MDLMLYNKETKTGKQKTMVPMYSMYIFHYV